MRLRVYRYQILKNAPFIITKYYKHDIFIILFSWYKIQRRKVKCLHVRRHWSSENTNVHTEDVGRRWKSFRQFGSLSPHLTDQRSAGGTGQVKTFQKNTTKHKEEIEVRWHIRKTTESFEEQWQDNDVVHNNSVCTVANLSGIFFCLFWTKTVRTEVNRLSRGCGCHFWGLNKGAL